MMSNRYYLLVSVVEKVTVILSQEVEVTPYIKYYVATTSGECPCDTAYS